LLFEKTVLVYHCDVFVFLCPAEKEKTEPAKKQYKQQRRKQSSENKRAVAYPGKIFSLYYK